MLPRLSLRALVLAAGIVTVAASCKHRDDPPAQPGYGYPPQPYPQPPYGYPPSGAYPQQPYPPQPYPSQPYPQPPRTQLTAAFGFFCQSDFEAQCPYGRCLGGRCGGCADATWCKPGAVCSASPVGGTCWPGGGGLPSQPPPTPSQPPPTPSFPPPGPVPVAPNPSDPFAAARQSCVDRINGFRAHVGRGAIPRDPSSEPCDDEESRLDSQSNRPHGTFGRCGERAQNACPNYPGASVEAVLSTCLQQMFDEGPGGGHYDNMTSTKYSRVSCGFQALPGGRIWTVQNFFP